MFPVVLAVNFYFSVPSSTDSFNPPFDDENDGEHLNAIQPLRDVYGFPRENSRICSGLKYFLRTNALFHDIYSLLCSVAQKGHVAFYNVERINSINRSITTFHGENVHGNRRMIAIEKSQDVACYFATSLATCIYWELTLCDVND